MVAAAQASVALDHIQSILRESQAATRCHGRPQTETLGYCRMGVHRLVEQRERPDCGDGDYINERGRSAGDIRCGSYRTPLSRFVTLRVDQIRKLSVFPRYHTWCGIYLEFYEPHNRRQAQAAS